MREGAEAREARSRATEHIRVLRIAFRGEGEGWSTSLHLHRGQNKKLPTAACAVGKESKRSGLFSCDGLPEFETSTPQRSMTNCMAFSFSSSLPPRTGTVQSLPSSLRAGPRRYSAVILPGGRTAEQPTNAVAPISLARLVQVSG